MKFTVFFFGVLAIEAAALNRPEKRQTQSLLSLGKGLLQSMNKAASKPTRAALTSTTLEPVYFKHARRQKLTWGPYTLNPSNVSRDDISSWLC
jgi:hypothetical protein